MTVSQAQQMSTPAASFKKRFLKMLEGKTRDDKVWMLHVIEGDLRMMDIMERYDARTVDREQIEQLG